MAPRGAFLGVGIAAVVLAVCLMTTSSLILDLIKENIRVCNATPDLPIFRELCKSTRWVTAGAALGIIAAIIQIASFGLCWMEKSKLWSGLHFVIFVFSVAAFSIAVDQGSFKSEAVDKAKAWAVFCLFDSIFSIAAAVFVFLKIKE